MSEIIRIPDQPDPILPSVAAAAAICYQCGACTATCPWGLVREETLSIRSLVRRAQLGLAPPETVWLCATCAQCQLQCPRGVDIGQVIGHLRGQLWQQRQTPAGLPSLLWSVYWNNNPWGQPPSQRARWAKSLDLPRYDAGQHELLLYVGCTASYDRRGQQVAHALVRLLRAAGVSFGVLGDEEPCCGESVLSLGHSAYFQQVAAETAQRFAAHSVGRLVTISPHCYDVFRNHYPQTVLGEGFQPCHYTQLLAELIGDGRLPLATPLARRVTFHDPCYLSRHNQETAAPRQILAAIPGLELVEMDRHGADTLCCGGGGGRMWLETAVGERFADLRIQEARDTGAELLVTACPFCIACLEDSLKAGRIQDLEVMDLAEITALALDDNR
jgi:Fe-S oxidoreductase